MTTQVQTIAMMKLLANVLHPLQDGTYQYDEGWNDDRVGKDTNTTGAQVRGLRTQLKMKLEPRERAFERLVRLHNELCNRTANGDLRFEFKKKEE